MHVFQYVVFLLPLALANDATVEKYASILPSTNTPGKGIVDFGKMNKCVLGVFGLDYNGYGCWCGRGGSGRPIDGIDRCCKIHDECYDKAHKKVCNVFQLYLKPYSFSCKGKVPTCSSSNNACQMALCRCDVAVSSCWKKFPIPSKKLKCRK